MDDNDRMWMLITIKDTREQLDRLWRMVCGDRGPNEIYKSVMDSTVETKGRSRWGKVSFNAGARSSIVEEQKPLEDDPDAELETIKIVCQLSNSKNVKVMEKIKKIKNNLVY